MEEENLVKKTCQELGITQKELAEHLKVSKNTITNWSKGEIEETTKILLEGLIYRKKFEDLQEILNFGKK